MKRKHTGNNNSCMHYPITSSLTAVSTAPGFWMRRALTTWNTSTTPSVLHISMAFTREQNTPTRLTVSLQCWNRQAFLASVCDYRLAFKPYNNNIMLKFVHFNDLGIMHQKIYQLIGYTRD